jgi:hypothetical protein
VVEQRVAGVVEERTAAVAAADAVNRSLDMFLAA